MSDRPIKRPVYKLFYDGERELAHRLREEGVNYSEIARRLGRNRSSVWAMLNRKRFNEMNKKAKVRARIRAQRNISEAAAEHYGFIEPTQDQWADRERRLLLEYPTLTAEFFGDPKPGYSALDRRKHG